MTSKIRPEVDFEIADQSFRVTLSFAVITRTFEKFGVKLTEAYNHRSQMDYEDMARFLYALLCANDEKGKSPLTVSEIGDGLVFIGWPASLTMVAEIFGDMVLGGTKDNAPKDAAKPEKK